MDEKKEEGTSAKAGCGIHCGCCACKSIKGLLLLLLGGVIGFGISHCYHGRRMMCPTAYPTQSQSMPMSPETTAPPKLK